ncbi:hypothetical protein HDU98_009597 [Podochytrium sp. JEL0797]|nr:hypothetical protein HDU98_009597 [Podochytrium sp. JEL0797]
MLGHANKTSSPLPHQPQHIPAYLARTGRGLRDSYMCDNDHSAKGAYGLVFRATRAKDSHKVAIKKQPRGDSIPQTYIRELILLQDLSLAITQSRFPFLLELLDYGSDSEYVYLAFDYVQFGLSDLMQEWGEVRGEPGCASLPGRNLMQVKHVTFQVALALAFLSDHGILHRDLKPDNILVANAPRHLNTGDVTVKLIDFGLARIHTCPAKPYSPNVQTIRYRAPEVFFQGEVYQEKSYSFEIDVWSLEILLGGPLFTGLSEIHVQKEMIETLGQPAPGDFPFTPSDITIQAKLIPRKSLDSRFGEFFERYPHARDLLKGFLTYDPTKRIHTYHVISHVFFHDVRHGYMEWAKEYMF